MVISTRYLSSFYLVVLSIVTMSCRDLRAESRPLVSHGTFFTYQGVNLSEQDVGLVNQMVQITQLPPPIIQMVEKAGSCGSIHRVEIITSDGKKYYNPCITLCSAEWDLLSTEEKSFILLHEAAHYMLGHCDEKDPAWVSHIVRRCGKEAFLLLGTITCGLTLGAIYPIIDIIRTKNLNAAKFVFPLSAINMLCYGYYRNYMVHMQRHECEADITACEYLQSASGGIHYFCRQTALPEKPTLYTRCKQILKLIDSYAQVIAADYFKISTHPSDYARIAYMREWQKKS